MPTDGPDNVQTPDTRADWVSVLGPLLVPDYYKPFQDLAPPAVDVSQDNTSFDDVTVPMAFGTVVPGWLRRFITSTDAVAGNGLAAPAGSHWNVFHQNVVRLMYAQIVNATGLRAVAFMSGGDLFASVNGLGRYQMHCTPNSSGPTVNDYIGLPVHPVLIECQLGAPVPRHSGLGLIRLSTNLEQITVPWSLTMDSIKGIAGALVGSLAPDANFGLDAAWVGSKADQIIAMGASTFLQQFNWPMSY